MVRPIKSTPLYIQCIGRGTRTLPPEIGNLPTRDERLESIANSEKPHMKVIDFVDIAGDHSLVTLPQLFGMSQSMRTGNRGRKMVKEGVRRVEELIEQNPHKEEQIRNADSFEEMDVEASKIDVWDVARVSDEIKDMSDLSWMRMGPDTFQLEVPADRRHTIQVERDTLGHWTTMLRYPTQYVDGRGKVEGCTVRSGKKYDEPAEAIEAVDEYVRSNHRNQIKIMEHSPSWGSKGASGGQKGFMDRLKIDYPDDITKGEASRLISAKLAMKKQEKRRTSASKVPSF